MIAEKTTSQERALGALALTEELVTLLDETKDKLDPPTRTTPKKKSPSEEIK